MIPLKFEGFSSPEKKEGIFFKWILGLNLLWRQTGRDDIYLYYMDFDCNSKGDYDSSTKRYVGNVEEKKYFPYRLNL